MRLEELEALYQLYSKDIYRYLCSLTHDSVWAEDLLSDTFLKAIRCFSSFEKRCSVKTWLFTIAHNVWIDDLRRKRPTVSYDDLLANYLEEYDSQSSCIDDTIDNRQLSNRVQQLLKECKPVAQQVILLRIQGYSFAEIAQRCNISENSARTLNFRTKNWLRTTLNKEGLL